MLAIVALGSNRSDRARHIARGLEAMEAAGFRLRHVTVPRLTRPLGASGRGHFLNCLAQVETSLLPRVALRRLRQIERAQGRHHRPLPGGSRGPRSLDLDLLLYGRARIATPELTLPHPRAMTRAFVRQALASLTT